MPHATEADIAPHQGMASEADVLPEQSFTAGATEYGHQLKAFGQGLWAKAKGAVSALLPDDASIAAVNAPIKVLAGAAEALHNHVQNLGSLVDEASESLGKGDVGGFIRHLQAMSTEGILPGVGQAADAAANKWDSGDKVGATADAAALTTELLAGAKSGDLARAGLNVGAYTVAGTRAAAPGVLAGLAKAGAGEVLSKVPGMELPARFGLQYPALRQVARSLEKGAVAGRAAIAPEVAPAEAAAAAVPTRPVTEMPAKTPGQLLAESDGKNWNKLGGTTKQQYEMIARANANTAAETPPQRPTPSGTPAAQPISAAAPERPVPAANVTPIRPEPVSTPAAAPAEVEPPAAEPEQVKTSGRTFVKDTRPSAEDYTLMEVPTAKIDAGWSKDGPEFYIPPGGGGAEIEGRMAGAKQFIESGQPIQAPRVSMAENGRIAFEDGRHRFSALRDAGDQITAVMVPNEQVGDFQALNKPQRPAAPEPTPAPERPTAAAAKKSARYADAITKWAADRGISPATAAEGWEAASPETRGVWILQMKRAGYLQQFETIPNTSAPGIVQALKDRAATRPGR